MDPDAISSLLAKVPAEIRIATRPLGSDHCWATLILLLDHDDGLRLREIERDLGTDRAEILPVLRDLTVAGLVGLVALRFEDIGNREASVYRATNLGKALIRALYRGLLPHRSQGED